MSSTLFESRFMIVLLVFGSLVAPVWLYYGFVAAALLSILHPTFPCFGKPHPMKAPAVGWFRHSLSEVVLYWLDCFLHPRCGQSDQDPKRNRRHYHDHGINGRLLDSAYWWKPRTFSLIGSSNTWIPSVDCDHIIDSAHFPERGGHTGSNKSDAHRKDPNLLDPTLYPTLYPQYSTYLQHLQHLSNPLPPL